jgi:hypothetical protein
MDWVLPAVTALAAFMGAMFSGFFVLRAQSIAQRNENIRHTRKVAYEAAVHQWSAWHRVYVERHARKTLAGGEMLPSLEDYIVAQILFLDSLDRLPLSKASDEEIANLFQQSGARIKRIADLRRKDEENNGERNATR